MQYEILNYYRFGSFVYGTFNRSSDIDIVLVVSDDSNIESVYESYKEIDSLDVEVFTKSKFQDLINEMDVKALECYFSDPASCMNYQFNFNETKLRESFSAVSSNSYVKAKKKLIVKEDYNVNVAIKSFFHSFRLLDFAIQISNYHNIIDWRKYNYILDDLRLISQNIEGEELWKYMSDKYKEQYNRLKSDFKKMVKLELSDSDKIRSRVVKVLTEYRINKSIIDDINSYFRK